MSDRPAALHLNDANLLHNGDGPAVVFRDGWSAYAWNGKAVPERWIQRPETVSPREFKGFDPTFAKFVAAKVGAPKSPKRPKPSTIVKAVLPEDPAARVEHLRAYAGGRLPRLDRYLAGEHQRVWSELVALGAAVREDPHAADALAVAYELMGRVASNVRTVLQRLRAMNYRFVMVSRTRGQETRIEPHVPPPRGQGKAILAFEKRTGVLPLSLRVFYEVVGEVNLIGVHPSLAPPDGVVTPDPLVVYRFDEQLVESGDEENGNATITLAPDDLHKADISGGDPYEIGIPDTRADAEVLNERHHLLFVDYLRLCFRYGGFPGYEGSRNPPAEIEALIEGLLDF